MTFSRKMFATDLSLVHFAQVVVGFPSSNAFDLLHNPGGNNFVQEKRLIRTRALQHVQCNIEERSNQVRVFVYCKDITVNGRHGNTFHNCSDFLTMLGYSRSQLPQKSPFIH